MYISNVDFYFNILYNNILWHHDEVHVVTNFNIQVLYKC